MAQRRHSGRRCHLDRCIHPRLADDFFAAHRRLYLGYLAVQYHVQRASLQQELLESDCQVEDAVSPTLSDNSFCVASTVDGDKESLPA